MTVRILAVCGNGQGSSMIMKMKVDQFCPLPHTARIRTVIIKTPY
ncbi:hypothetical protein P381_14500 [Salmonella enterica subsp. enterica serovar Enteritidis str. 10-34587]|nr:hypothetical protein P381_14500 [Salmonella enterica subsp. enterica serovar Enteritidis str. 10-34587]